MNKARRKNLQEIIDQLEKLKSSLEEIAEEEAKCRDGIPENFQSGERYEKAVEACDNLDDAVSDLEEVIGSIETAIE